MQKNYRGNKILYAKSKLKSFFEIMENKFKKVLNIPANYNLEAIKSNYHEDLMNHIKEKIKNASKKEQIQFLTLAPKEWSYYKISKEFKVSKYLAKKAIKIRQEKGILGKPERKARSDCIPEEIKIRVTNFYCNDLNSRIMPGKKECVKIKKHVYEQKRLILCNLGELYALYKQEYSADKLGFSTFCNLRPKWCVLPDASGTHTVCVCSICQNFKLAVRATKTSLSWKEFISKLVCDSKSRNCMFGICDKCSNKNRIDQIIHSELFPIDVESIEESEYGEEDSDDDDDEEEEFELIQWVCTDRADLITKKLVKSEFVLLLKEQLNKLLSHLFI